MPVSTSAVKVNPLTGALIDPPVATFAAANGLLTGGSSDAKNSVVAATTTIGDLSLDFTNGDTIDGVILVTGDRLLIKNQFPYNEQNGIYIVAASGAPTRATDFDTWDEIIGAFVSVESGTVNAGTQWLCNAVPGGVMDSNAITFVVPKNFVDLTTNQIVTGTKQFATITASFLNGITFYSGSGSLTLSTFALTATNSGNVITSASLGANVGTALAIAVGSAGAFVTFNGAGGTPSSMTGTNISGTAASLNIGGNAGTATALATARNIFGISFDGTANVAGDATNTGHFASIPGTGAAGHFVTQNGTAPTVIAGRSAWYSDGSGVPSFKNGTGTAVTLVRSSDLGTGIATFLTTPSSANLAAAVTDETGSGALVFGTSPTITTSLLCADASFTAFAGATTLLTIGGTGASASMFAPSTLDTTSSTTGAIRTSGGISAAKALNIGTSATIGGNINLPTASSTVGRIIQNGVSVFSTYGTGNLFIGTPSATSGNVTLTTAEYNVGLGRNTLVALTTGDFNMAIGNAALFATTTGSNNVAIAASALQGNISGGSNVAIGLSALLAYNSDFATAVGASTLTLATGIGNTAIGRGGGNSVTTGTYNLFLGYNSGNNASQLISATNSIAIGANTFTTASNSVVIGDSAITATQLAGNVTIIAAGGSGNLIVPGTLAITGATTLTGNLTSNGALISTPQALTTAAGTGAVNLTTLTTEVTTTGVLDALTLANGTAGQIKTIIHKAGAFTSVLTPTTALGFTSITFLASLGQTATLQYTSAGWVILAVGGSTLPVIA